MFIDHEINFSGFTVMKTGRDVVVSFSGESSLELYLSREEALDLSCKLEQAAQKIKESEDSRKGVSDETNNRTD